MGSNHEPIFKHDVSKLASFPIALAAGGLEKIKRLCIYWPLHRRADDHHLIAETIHYPHAQQLVTNQTHTVYDSRLLARSSEQHQIWPRVIEVSIAPGKREI